MARRLSLFVVLVALFASLALPSGAVIPGVGVVSKRNIDWVFNNPQLVGSDIEFFERKLDDGTLKRYAIAGAIGHGFQIIDITNPRLPLLAGVFSDPGVNWQGDPQVNPRRNIVSIATDGAPAATVGHGGVASGIALVDITNITTPTLLSTVRGIGGAHNSTIIDDRFIYTALPTRIVDYADPRNPIVLPANRASFICGHDLTVDPNRPDRLYSACSSNNPATFQIVDISDPANPRLIRQLRDPALATPHQADPAPDSSFIVVSDERGGGLTNALAPGGGGHVYDISGKYIAGASETNPRKMGIYFAPFNGATEPASNSMAGPWGNVTMHNFTFQAERFLFSVGWYSMGSWVVDMEHATDEAGNGHLYNEWDGNQFNNGPTTWGNTQGNILLEGDNVWSTKWTRFDDPLFDRFLFTNGLTRGMDTLFYTGGLPKKVARLRVDPTSDGTSVTGTLDRYAVWTFDGWVNKPLAGRTVSVFVEGIGTRTGVTDAAGRFSIPFDLGSGTHQVEARWIPAPPDDAVYRPAIVQQTVTVAPRQADLSITKTDSPDPVLVGRELTYTLEVTNAGPDDATAVTVTDTLPAAAVFKSASPGCSESAGTVTCALGGLAAGDSATVEIVVVPQDLGTLENQASVTGNEADPDPADNQATASTEATCTITGTAGSDTLQGTSGDDVICGLGGNDDLKGLDGNDWILGGDGADKVLAGGGNDVVLGGAGDDDLRGAEGDDRLHGGPGFDKLNGGEGNDSCFPESDGGTTQECES